MTDQCPCETCITLPICRNRCTKNPYIFIMNIRDKCPYLNDYLITSQNKGEIVLDFHHAVEAGRLLGYKIGETENHQRIIKSIEDPHYV